MTPNSYATTDEGFWDDVIDYDEREECWECHGDGGWNRCLSDCCPAVGGEEDCTDKHCWCVCPNCKGDELI